MVITIRRFFSEKRLCIEGSNMKQTYLFWDLDGTLTDSGPGIINSVKYTLRKMGKEIPAENVLRKFIGPPLIYSFQEYSGMSEEEAQLGVMTYREYYAETGLFENKVYEGIEPVLKKFQEFGKKLVVATSKPEKFSVRIIGHFGLDSYFTMIAGSSMDESRNTKEAVIRYAIQRLGIENPQNIIMIGDREYDVRGAKQCGIDCIGVLWGYGSKEELQSAGAVAVAESPEHLFGLLE